MHFPRMPIEAESPEQRGYDRVRFNLAESSVRDRSLGDLGVELSALTLCYGDHRGDPTLRALIAARTGGGLTPDDVLITAGASAALFIVAISLLQPGDHVVVERPNYATNIVTPRVLGCSVDCLDLDFDRGFALDLDALAGMTGPETKLISLTTPHNPTGVALDAESLRQVIGLAEPGGAYVLVDETYREMSFAPKPPPVATVSDRAISVGSLSKSFGIPGIRVGWIASRSPSLMHRFLCAKEQIGICGSVVDEAIAAHALARADAWLEGNDRRLRDALARVTAWIAGEPLLEWVAPNGGCVCFPRVRPAVSIDTDAFYRVLDDDHGTFVGPGHWFEQSDRSFRIGYGWPSPAELEGGLGAISQALRAAG